MVISSDLHPGETGRTRCLRNWPDTLFGLFVVCIRLYPCVLQFEVAELFDLDRLNEDDPFEIDAQAAHLFKHPRLGIEDIREVWASDPMFYPAKPPAHWLMVAEVDGNVLMVSLAPARDQRRQPDTMPADRLLSGLQEPC